MDSKDDLPPNWILTTLGNIAKLSTGGTPSRMKKEYWGGNIPWVKISDIPEDGIVTKTEETINQLGLSNSNAKIFPQGTILFTLFATIGKTGVLGIEATTNQAICGITPVDFVDRRYLFHYLRYAGTSLARKTHGITQANINSSIAKALQVPLPPVREQSRIVAKLETLLQESHSVTSALEKIPKLLRKFKQSMLISAFKGGLATQDDNDESIENGISARLKVRAEKDQGRKKRLSFDSKLLDGDLEPLPKGWKWIRLGELLVELQYGTSEKAASTEQDGIPILRMGNIKDGKLDLANMKFISPDTKAIESYYLRNGDILINRTNSPELVGKSALFSLEKRYVFASYLIKLVTDRQVALPNYINYFISSFYGR